MRRQFTAINHWQIKIFTLWTTFLLALLFHTQLALMPLFNGLNVAESHTHDYASLDVIFWLMWIFFLLPLLSILGTIFMPSRSFRVSHFYMTLLYTVLDLGHFLADFLVGAPGYQLLLIIFLVGVGLLLNITAYQWMLEGRSSTFHNKNTIG